MVIARLGGKEKNGALLVKGYKISVMQDELKYNSTVNNTILHT